MWITEWHVVQWILHNICRYMESTRNTNKHIQFLWKEIHNVVTNIFMCKHIPCLSVSSSWYSRVLFMIFQCLYNIWDTLSSMGMKWGKFGSPIIVIVLQLIGFYSAHYNYISIDFQSVQTIRSYLFK